MSEVEAFVIHNLQENVMPSLYRLEKQTNGLPKNSISYESNLEMNRKIDIVSDYLEKLKNSINEATVQESTINPSTEEKISLLSKLVGTLKILPKMISTLEGIIHAWERISQSPVKNELSYVFFKDFQSDI